MEKELTASIIGEIASLKNIFDEFQKSFEKLNQFKEILVEKLEERKKRPLTRTEIEIHEIIHEIEREEEENNTINIEFDNNFENEIISEDETQNESARSKILELIRNDSSDDEEAEMIEPCTITDLMKKYNIKNPEIKLHRVDNSDKIILKDIQDIDNLCDIDGFIDRISNSAVINKGNKSENKIQKTESTEDQFSEDDFENDVDETNDAGNEFYFCFYLILIFLIKKF
jgi:hypothetical protein